MLSDFRDAAERHWGDAEYLFADTRLANADHLFGLAAECALKAVMQALGMALGSSGAPVDQQYRVHINRLWDEFVSFASGRSGGKYAAALIASANLFANWDVNQRYEHRSQFMQVDVQRHQQGAKHTMSVLQQAVIDGVVT